MIRPMMLRLSYRPPFDWGSMLGFLAYRAVPGVEWSDGECYARTISLDGVAGHIMVRPLPGRAVLGVDVHFADGPAMQGRGRGRQQHGQQGRRLTEQVRKRAREKVREKVQHLFDLPADSVAIEKCLSRDRLLGRIIARYPGLRVPGCWDGFEVAVRAVLGQQVTVKAAATLTARLVQRHGAAYACEELPQLQRLFPDADTLCRGRLDRLGIVGGRVQAIKGLARGVRDGALCIEAGADPAVFRRRICEVKGIGEWTAQYIAMRALQDGDAFPHADLILQRAAAPRGAAPLSPAQLLQRAEAWHPWRAYAVLLLWKHYSQQAKAKTAKSRKTTLKQT